MAGERKMQMYKTASSRDFFIRNENGTKMGEECAGVDGGRGR